MQKIKVKGVILNYFHPENEMEQDNYKMIERRMQVPIVACVQESAERIDLSIEKLVALYES